MSFWSTEGLLHNRVFIPAKSSQHSWGMIFGETGAKARLGRAKIQGGRGLATYILNRVRVSPYREDFRTPAMVVPDPKSLTGGPLASCRLRLRER